MTYKKAHSTFMLDDGRAVTLYNAISGNLDRFTDAARGEVLRAMSEAEGIPAGACGAYLAKRGYALASDTDELERIRKMHEDMFENRDILFLTILPTMQCNFRCKYCCEDTYQRRLTQEMQDQLITFLSRNLYRYKRLVVAWFGGEPLLEPEWIVSFSQRAKALCRENRVHYSASVTTNGYDLDAALLKRLVACNIVQYWITLDGDEETHDAQRQLKCGKGTWKRIVKNLREIRDTVSSQTFVITLRTNVTTSFLRTGGQHIEFLKREFSADRRFNFMWKKAEDWGNIEEADKALLCDQAQYLEFMAKLKQSGLRDSMTVKMIRPFERICPSSPQNSLVIFPDGRISKCSRDVSPAQTTIGPIGDLLECPEDFLSKTTWDVLESSAYHCGADCKNYFRCLGLTCPMENDECAYQNEYFLKIMDSIQDQDLENGLMNKFGGAA